MTKKDYELIARAVANAIEYADIPYALATELAKDNPRFDRNKFLKACGITD